MRRSPSPPDVMDMAAQFPSIIYIVFAGSIPINKNRTASNYSIISCRNSPHRQLKFAIGRNTITWRIFFIIRAVQIISEIPTPKREPQNGKTMWRTGQLGKICPAAATPTRPQPTTGTGPACLCLIALIPHLPPTDSPRGSENDQESTKV
jgi:hypothetical protein